MKRAHLVAILGLTLMLSAVTPSAVLAQADVDSRSPHPLQPAAAASLPVGHIAVFLIPYMSSQTGSPSDRTATIVSITNVGGTTACPTSVDWRLGFGGAACTTTLNLSGGAVATNNIGATGEHCSRSVPGAVAACNATCAPDLTGIEGKAVVGTTSACVNRIAVDARLYHLGPGDVPTNAVADLKVVRLPQNNKGD